MIFDMDKLIKLDDWAVTDHPDDYYVAPECRKRHLHGRVTGHQRIRDGKKVITSSILAVSGRFVTTRSGSVYLLGDPSPGYKEYLDEHYPGWDPENPIK